MALDLSQIRRAARVSQVELAALTGIARTRLSAAERGYITLTEAEVGAIRRVIAGEPQRRARRIKEALIEKPLSNPAAAGRKEKNQNE